MKFSGRHFPKDIVLQAVRWYITYPLSLRMIKEILGFCCKFSDKPKVNILQAQLCRQRVKVCRQRVKVLPRLR